VLPELRTARLRLVPISDEHLPLLEELNGDAEVMAYLLGRAATSAETTAEWRRRLDHQSDPGRGLGYWAVLEDEVFVGWCSASSFADRPEVAGIGYRLRRSAWGHGIATEVASAMVAQAFAAPAVETVFASTMAVNEPSRRVLAKAGLRHTSTWHDEWEDPVPGAEQGEVGYELTRAEWEASA